MNFRQISLNSLRYILFLTSLMAGYSFADVYKCVDNAGRVFYQNNECGDHATELGKIRTGGPEQSRNDKRTSLNTNKIILNKNLLSNSDFENHLIKWKFKSDVSWRTGIGVNGSAAVQIHARKPPDNKYIYETVVSTVPSE